MKCCVSGNCTLLTCFPVHKLSHMYIIQIFVFPSFALLQPIFEDEFTWKRVNLFLCVISPCPGGAGLLFNVLQQTDLRLVCFLISFMLVQFPSRLFLGLEWKNGPEASIPWQHHHTLPISINYWDTTGFVCSFGNSSAYIEVQIVDFFFLFSF